jgi:hypothetical protein
VGTGFEPENPVAADELNFILNNHGQWIDNLDSVASISIFGNGSDGSAVLDGVSSVTWASRVGSVYTLSRDVALVNLTINAGVTLKLGGCRLCGQGTLTTNAGSPNGKVSGDGSTGTPGNSGGVAVADTGSVLPAGGTGGNGGTFTLAPTVGQSITGNGGNGNTGGLGGGGGGAAGGSTSFTTNKGNPAVLPFLLGFVVGNGASPAVTQIGGGAGGGGGAADSVSSTFGGGGGNGGYSGVVAFRNLALASASDITCAGGNGGAAGTTGNTGGGGGGGGGTLLLIYYAATAGLVFSSATNCPGGAGAAGHGSGTAGLAGATGHLYPFNLGAAATSLTLATTHDERGFVAVNSGDTSKTITFATPFAAAAPSVGGYVFEYSIARTDGVVGMPATIAGTPGLANITINIIDDFQGVIFWKAQV